MKRLTHRQRLFIEAYISTRGNGTEAMRRAGYRGSDKALAAHASRMVGR
jgi:phage terminase small subunit